MTSNLVDTGRPAFVASPSASASTPVSKAVPKSPPRAAAASAPRTRRAASTRRASVAQAALGLALAPFGLVTLLFLRSDED